MSLSQACAIVDTVRADVDTIDVFVPTPRQVARASAKLGSPSGISAILFLRFSITLCIGSILFVNSFSLQKGTINYSAF